MLPERDYNDGFQMPFHYDAKENPVSLNANEAETSKI